MRSYTFHHTQRAYKPTHTLKAHLLCVEGIVKQRTFHSRIKAHTHTYARMREYVCKRLTSYDFKALLAIIDSCNNNNHNRLC